ncbi:MAG: hypothetical protein QXX95_01715 [Nitrososphaerales archaeon]
MLVVYEKDGAYLIHILNEISKVKKFIEANKEVLKYGEAIYGCKSLWDNWWDNE